ncbi:doxx family protein [Cellulophaga sp. HaHaR_3_176]|uniref:doxx family protein n=1 Tax=Cellulophaga sp. HaHaR_3_176 TaxID=1942464 RepID=UPI001C77482C|nr:doxx family protein [Cellulophaga sp. HaHaR_3_176]QWX85611.1 doxx family protein [Cellulophaga sp. HaHaR_3_176]
MTFKNRISQNHILAFCIGLVYVWFGVLKYFSGESPAEELAKNTINLLTYGLIPSKVSILLLALSETIIGLLLILNIYRKQVVIVALIHIAFTFTPLFLFPEESFTNSIFSFSLLGQYIFKNIVIIGALITLYKSPIITIEIEHIK